MKSVMLIVALLMAMVLPAKGENIYGLPDGLYAQVKTSKGVIVGELYDKKVPVTVAHYVGLAEGTLGPRKGTPFFDGARILRVDFVIQTGEPPRGVRIPGFPDEMVPGLRHDGMGVMQTSNDGPDTNGSYWCFMMEDTPRLNYLHTVFGRVVKGMEVLPLLKVNDRIETLRILRIGPEAEKYSVDDDSFAALVAKAKKYDDAKLPRQPGPDAFFDDPDKVLPQPGGASRYSRARDFNFKLGKFFLFTGQPIKARVVGKFAGVDDAVRRKTYVEDLAQTLGTHDKGALAVYFAQKDVWEVWVGRQSQGEFMRGPREADGTKHSTHEWKTMDSAMEAFLNQTQATGEALIAKEEKTTGKPVPADMQVKLKVDAILDALIFRLEPAAPAN
jgi:cyclophilin family peptidyl-prolyl cis-trans isomerase